MIVYWGSQSGRAEKLAASFARECTARYGLRAATVDLDDHDHEHLSEVPSSKLVVFIVSTFGEGDPTDNSYRFCSTLKTLRDAGNPSLLKDLRYAAFGLGNKNYKHYNRIVDLVDEMLVALGAQRLGTVGRADEAKGGMATEEDFLEWKESMLDTVRVKFGVEERQAIYSPELDIVPAKNAPDANSLPHEDAQNYRNPTLAAPLVVGRELTSGTDRRCLHLEFDVSANRKMKYQTGDHLVVWPHNSVTEVERLYRLLGLTETERQEAIEIRSQSNGNTATSFPSPTTKATLLRHYLDISGPVSRDVLRLLAGFCPTPTAHEFITTLAKDKDKFNTLVSTRCLTLGKVMQLAAGEVVWTKLPFTFLLECLGKLQPRYYSIASSPSVSPLQPAITLVITTRTSDPTPSDPNTQFSRFYGVASNYLLAVRRRHDGNNEEKSEQQQPPKYEITNNQVLVQIRRSTFKLPANPQRPIIMIGAGTGIAPFRAFVQERAILATRGIPVGPTLLFFGCRSPTEDYLYQEEWRDHAKKLPGLEIINAFSRLDKNNKIYVQDRLVQNKEKVMELLNQDASVYICGSADMARGVRSALMEVLMDMKGWTQEQAERHIMGEMKRARRLQEDVWSS